VVDAVKERFEITLTRDKVLVKFRNRQVATSRLVRPVVTLDFSEVRARGRRLPPGADEFTAFLQQHIARWAGRAGVL
jgi:hypothetical protein